MQIILQLLVGLCVNVCVFKLGASRLKISGLFDALCFFPNVRICFLCVTLWKEKINYYKPTTTSNPICFNIRRALVVSSDRVFETSLGSRDTIFKVSSRS